MSLHITLGPMYSGKTTKLITQSIIEKNNNRKAMIIDYNTDEDIDDCIGFMENHDHQKVSDVFKVRSLINNDLLEKVTQHDTILINEAQFFPTLDVFVDYCMTCSKNVYLYGLDGDFERKPMGHMINLIPKCDTVTKLNGICFRCKVNLSIFSHRICENKEQVLFDHTKYVPLCRNCYMYAKSTK